METSWRIRFRRLGPVVDGDIEVRPFTILMGPNGCGKSYLANTLFLSLTQDFGAAHFPRPKNTKQKGSSFVATFAGPAICKSHQEALVEHLRQTFQCPKVPLEGFSADLDWLPTADLTVSRSSPPRVEGASQDKRSPSAYHVEWKSQSDSANAIAIYFDRRDLAAWWNADEPETGDMSAMAAIALQQATPTVSYLPASRSGLMSVWSHLVDRALGATIEGKGVAGPASYLPSHVASFVRRLSFQSDQKPGPLAKIADYLEERAAGGKWIVQKGPRPSPPRYVFRPIGCGQDLDVNLASSGAVELLPLIETLRHVSDGKIGRSSVLFIEEPEAHLHPAAQLAVARALVKARNLGLRIIVTTHSDFFLQEINNLVKAGRLRTRRNRKKILDSLGIDADATLAGDDVAAYLFVPTDGCSYHPMRLGLETGGVPVSQINDVIGAQSHVSMRLHELLEQQN